MHPFKSDQMLLAGIFLFALAAKAVCSFELHEEIFEKIQAMNDSWLIKRDQPRLNSSYEEGLSLSKKTSEVVTIEVLAIVEHVLADILGSDEDIKLHVSAEWNACNRFFREFKDPEIKLKLVAIHIFRSEKEEEFIVIGQSWGKDFVGMDTLQLMPGWLAKNKATLPKYDMAHLHCARAATAGLAWGSPFCGSGIPVTYSVDKGESSYRPRVIAHEVGHLFGVGDCMDDQRGYVMCHGGILIGNFTDASANIIYSTLRPLIGSCISTSEATEEQLSKFNFNRTVLPGDIISLNTTCERHYGKGSYSLFSESTCERVMCIKPNGEKSGDKTELVASYGTRVLCPSGQRCLEGYCKAE